MAITETQAEQIVQLTQGMFDFAVGGFYTDIEALVDGGATMLEVADAYDPAIPAAENEAYVARVREIRGPWQEELAEMMKDIRASDTPAE